MLVILVHFHLAAHTEKLSSWPTRLRFPVQEKPGGTIEHVPLMSFLKITKTLHDILEKVIDDPSGWDDESISLISSLLGHLERF